MGYISHPLKVPAAKFHRNPADMFPCCLRTSLDWLMGNSLLPLLLEGIGDWSSKKNTLDPLQHWWVLHWSQAPRGGGAVSRFLLRGSVLHLLVWMGSGREEVNHWVSDMSTWACTNLRQCLDKLALLKNKVAVAQINEGHLKVENYSVNNFLGLFFNWRITALQCCVGFCHTTPWIGHKYTRVPPSWTSLPPF